MNFTNIIRVCILMVLLALSLVGCGNDNDTGVGTNLRLDRCSNPNNPNCEDPH